MTPIWEAATSGGFTIVAAAVGAAVVMHQIRKQGEQGRQQTAEAERLRLNLKIYDEVTAAVRSISASSIKLSTAIHRIKMQLDNAQIAGPPKDRFLEFGELVSEANLALAEGIEVVERWFILDRRLDVFQEAFNVAGEDLRHAYYQRLARQLLLTLPMDLPNGTHWIPPTPEDRATLDEGLNALWRASEQGASYATDFQNAMQGLLLAELGRGQAPVRKPLDPALIAVTLENRDEVMGRFDRETRFAQVRRQAEADALAEIAKRP